MRTLSAALALMLFIGSAAMAEQREETSTGYGSSKIDACKRARDSAKLWPPLQAMQGCKMNNVTVGECMCEASSGGHNCMVVSRGTCSSDKPASGSGSKSSPGETEMMGFSNEGLSSSDSHVAACGAAKGNAASWARAYGYTVVNLSACDCAQKDGRWYCSLNATVRKK